MEVVISICLGLWVVLAGIICSWYISKDEKREQESK